MSECKAQYNNNFNFKCVQESKLLGKSLMPAKVSNAIPKMPRLPATSMDHERTLGKKGLKSWGGGTGRIRNKNHRHCIQRYQ